VSRVGRLPITLPKGVTVQVEAGNEITVQGPKGKLTRAFSPDIQIDLVDGEVRVTRPSDHRNHRMLHGLTRALLANMVQGVSDGFSKTLQIEGVGYRAEMQGSKLVLHMGYSHPVEMPPPEGITFTVDRSGRVLTVAGIDKEVVGLTAARIRSVRPPEPYHGKGIRYQGEMVRRKQGKTGK
jgi:large subunit ribosomal protein L6